MNPERNKSVRDVARNFSGQEFIRAARELAEISAAASDALRQTYREKRQCTATKSNGEPCKAWALWNCPEQLCAAHYYSTRGPELTPDVRTRRDRQRNRPTCDCEAYPFPHRPNNGLCRWPEDPIKTHPLSAGRRSPGKLRRRDSKRKLAKAMRQMTG